MNKLIFSFVLAFLPFVSPIAAAEDELTGTYKLISSTRKILETGEVKNSYGEHPSGYIMYGTDGRFLVLITYDGRPKPASIDSMTDQAGRSFSLNSFVWGDL